MDLGKYGITDWRKIKRHTISAAYPDLAGAPWDQMVVDMKNHGWVGEEKIILAYDEDGELKVGDGWQRYRACLEINLEPPFEVDEERDQNKLYERYRVKNNNRRHETREAQRDRIEKRREFICRALADGNSQREVARKLDISESQVRKDIDAINLMVDAEDGKDNQGYRVRTSAQFDPDKFKSAIKMALKQIHLAKEGRDGETQVYLDSRYTDLEHLGYDVTERLKKSRVRAASKQNRIWEN